MPDEPKLPLITIKTVLRTEPTEAQKKKEALQTELTDWTQQRNEARNDRAEADERVWYAQEMVDDLHSKLLELVK